ncbi:hypothetical protein E1176_13695 [Fulvivirga sp. RKSG066]|nr:hypothetical protein [Fulvivirga aurantia]
MAPPFYKPPYTQNTKFK